MACVLLGILASFLVAEPSDANTDLLKRYLGIRTDHPIYGTAAAAKMWMAEAEKENIQAATWSVDPAGKCVNFLAYFPAPTPTDLSPVILLHHADTVPVVEAEWKYPPFSPQWVNDENDWLLYGRGVIDDKGPGVVHWAALKNLKAKSHKRDAFFIMNCGEEVGDLYGAPAFVNFFIRKLEGFQFELSTLAKLETAHIIQKFRQLPKAGWVWNEGSFGDKTHLAPYTLVPVAVAQKGHWMGRVKISGIGGHNALASKITPFESLIRGMTSLYDENRSSARFLHSLHPEMQKMAAIAGQTRPVWQRLLLWFYPRLFYELAGLQTLVQSWWTPSLPITTALLPNMVASEASTAVEYRFLGDHPEIEISNHVRNAFSKFLTPPLQVLIEQTNYIPFRRDFFEGEEAKTFEEVLTRYPHVLVSPFITPGITDSRFFRLAGIRAFDLVPFFLTAEQMSGMHGRDERLPYTEFKRGIEIETKILERLLQ